MRKTRCSWVGFGLRENLSLSCGAAPSKLEGYSHSDNFGQMTRWKEAGDGFAKGNDKGQSR